MKEANATGLAIIRIITGLLMVYHGLEIFQSSQMQEYASWDSIKDMPFPAFWAYLGKGAELVGGVLLAVGFMTRTAAILIAGTMLFITFKIGGGKFWYEAQHPFLFVLLALVYFFTGPGKWSVDNARK
ncbi:DoxX family protein [Emticicia sp. C21]|uniref:DoxX family protein n=1 Tax=Emticicia sp. C21 TaxID=2302915 RepID=UPI000E351B16|nr:DoxX family protein [Emticicia sp. C21]RFS13967.1 DoxX family protein [Emticicia sp. C21]